MSSLLVILSDPISPILEKGEVTERYYNPGNVFSEVHFLLLNDDQPELNSLQYMVGDAKVQIHNYSMPRRLSLKTLGWNRGLLEYFIGDAVGIVRGIDPDVIRTLGLSLDLVVARMAKKELGIPHIASLHTHPHQPPQKLSLINRFFKNGVDRYRAEALKEADEVLPVYKPIISFLESLGVDDYRVCYNVLNSSAINRKKNYEIEELVKVAYVGRQYKDKDPSNLICAVANIEGVYLTLYGDGPFHDRLKSLVKALKAEDKIVFVPSMENSELCRQLSNFDLFAVHSDCWEISKSVLEALLTGLPIIINRLENYKIPELNDDICFLVDNTVEGYQNALEQLSVNKELREKIGFKAQEIAWERWAPDKMEAVYCDIYRSYLSDVRSI